MEQAWGTSLKLIVELSRFHRRLGCFDRGDIGIRKIRKAHNLAIAALQPLVFLGRNHHDAVTPMACDGHRLGKRRILITAKVLPEFGLRRQPRTKSEPDRRLIDGIPPLRYVPYLFYFAGAAMSSRNGQSEDAAKSPPRICRVNARPGQFGPGNPGRPFPPGNPGRPKGARNKATTMLAAMFAGEAESIGRKAIELAKEGKVGAVRLVLDRAYPSRKGHVIDGVKLPAIKSAADTVAAMAAIVAAISAGTLTTDEARDLSAVIEVYRKTHELAEIEHRLVAVERAIADAQPVGWSQS
jgi:hypothetical protein